MNAAMVHRGPDDEGTFTDPEVGLSIGARRLSIIDVVGGHQPLSNEDRTVWAALNGEIYNHPSLRERLAFRGHRLQTRTDTECLVHLYEDFGDHLVHALEGMFAFALWDSRSRNLLIARDRFGEKPLFYRASGQELTFASELTPLLHGLPSQPGIDPGAVDAFFIYGYVPGPRSIVEGILQLPPGHLLRWSREEGLRVHRYWSPPEDAGATPASMEELATETRDHLERSVRSRMIADVPLGVLLSGGIDSTLIAALASQRADAHVKSFSVGYGTGSVDERDAARLAARALGTDHHELIVDEAQLPSMVRSVAQALDQPLADPALIAMGALARFAREEVTVVVGGEGADELFGGYPRYRWLERARRLDSLPRAPRSTVARALRGSPESRLRRLGGVVEPVSSTERHLDWITEGRRHVRPAIYGPCLLPEVGREGVLLDLQARLAQGHDGSLAGKFMRLDQQHWLTDDVLMKADRAGMLVSLEVRTPYLHRELAELASSIPSAVHLAGSGKALLRRVLAQIAPQVARRRKAAFRVPLASWVRGPLAPVFETQLQSGVLFREGWIDAEAIKLRIDEHRSHRRDHAAVLWPVLILGLWLDAHRGRQA